MKNQKGITLMLLVATLAIMAIIIGTLSYNSIAGLRLKLYYDMCADIELLDEKVALYYLENKSLPTTDKTIEIGELITDYGENNVNYNPNNSGKLYLIDLSKMENLSLNNPQYEFYIDEQSHTIYFTRGIALDGYTYYTVPLDYEEVVLSNYR